MSLLNDLKEKYNSTDPVEISVDGLPTFYAKPLTLGQIRQISSEDDTFTNVARHFQVRAKDADGKPLVTPSDFDEFMRYADADLITAAVAKMQAMDSDSFEETEKKS